jgi:hypothetical protein
MIKKTKKPNEKKKQKNNYFFVSRSNGSAKAEKHATMQAILLLSTLAALSLAQDSTSSSSKTVDCTGGLSDLATLLDCAGTACLLPTDTATICSCTQKTLDCARSISTCKISKASDAEKEACLKQCPGLAACSPASQLVASVSALLVAAGVLSL